MLRVYRRGDGVRGRRLRGRAEIELDTVPGREISRRSGSSRMLAQPGDRCETATKAPVAGANGDEGAVIAGESKRAPDGGIDETAGAPRDVDRERDGLEETPRDADALAGAAVQRRQLRVRPETAGQEVDLAEPAHELSASVRKRRRIGDADDRAGAECA